MAHAVDGVELAHREPIDLDGLFAWMRARAIDGVEQATARSFARTLRLRSGEAWFRIRRENNGRLVLDARMPQRADLDELVAVARRLFDLDADPARSDEALSAHPELAPLVAATPGIRVPGTADPHELLVRAMIGQQISVAAARTHLNRLVAELGEPIDAGEGPMMLFPTAATIAARGAEVLRGPGARIRALTGVAAALATGDLPLGPDDDGAAQRRALLAMPGIGPWTADYVRMRVTGDPDVLLPGDVALRAGAAAVGLPADAAGITAWAARVAPWRSFLSAHLWRAAAAR